REYAAGAGATRTQPAASADEARANLTLRVRDREWFGLMELRIGGPITAAYQPLNDQIALEIVYDLPAAVRSVSTTELEAWGIDLDEAVRTARANLRERTP